MMGQALDPCDRCDTCDRCRTDLSVAWSGHIGHPTRSSPRSLDPREDMSHVSHVSRSNCLFFVGDIKRISQKTAIRAVCNFDHNDGFRKCDDTASRDAPILARMCVGRQTEAATGIPSRGLAGAFVMRTPPHPSYPRLHPDPLFWG